MSQDDETRSPASAALTRSFLFESAFTREFLTRLFRRKESEIDDEPGTMPEAARSGPWKLSESDGLYSIWRAWETSELGDPPLGEFENRSQAVRALATLYARQGAPRFRLAKGQGESGGPIVALGEGGEQRVGFLSEADRDFVSAFEVIDSLAQNPLALAILLDSAGRRTLETTGKILARGVDLSLEGAGREEASNLPPRPPRGKADA